MKIVSGGQTGVDQMALRIAQRHNIPTGGWAPKGWRTEFGAEPSLRTFGLVEHESGDYPGRTVANVQNSDGTVWFGGPDFGGYMSTRGACTHQRKPFFEVLDPSYLNRFVEWVRMSKIQTLNCAGPRYTRDMSGAAQNLCCVALTLLFTSEDTQP